MSVATLGGDQLPDTQNWKSVSHVCRGAPRARGVSFSEIHPLAYKRRTVPEFNIRFRIFLHRLTLLVLCLTLVHNLLLPLMLLLALVAFFLHPEVQLQLAVAQGHADRDSASFVLWSINLTRRI